jgi:hypothetical protein
MKFDLIEMLSQLPALSETEEALLRHRPLTALVESAQPRPTLFETLYESVNARNRLQYPTSLQHRLRVAATRARSRS